MDLLMTPAEVKSLRQAAGLTQKQAAALVGVSMRTWQSWEDDGPNGRTAPDMAIELFRLKCRPAKTGGPI